MQRFRGIWNTDSGEMVRIYVDEATHGQLEALGRLAGLLVTGIVRTLSHIDVEVLQRLGAVRAVNEQRERAAGRP